MMVGWLRERGRDDGWMVEREEEMMIGWLRERGRDDGWMVEREEEMMVGWLSVVVRACNFKSDVAI